MCVCWLVLDVSKRLKLFAREICGRHHILTVIDRRSNNTDTCTAMYTVTNEYGPYKAASSTDIQPCAWVARTDTLAKQGVMGGARCIPLERAMRMARLQITHVQIHACRETPRRPGGCDELSCTAVEWILTKHGRHEGGQHPHTKRSLLPQTSRTRESTGAKEGFPNSASGLPCDVDVGQG